MYLASAFHHGITTADFKEMTIGMVLDVLSEFIPEKDRVRIATQADWDALARS